MTKDSLNPISSAANSLQGYLQALEPNAPVTHDYLNRLWDHYIPNLLNAIRQHQQASIGEPVKDVLLHFANRYCPLDKGDREDALKLIAAMNMGGASKTSGAAIGTTVAPVPLPSPVASCEISVVDPKINNAIFDKCIEALWQHDDEMNRWFLDEGNIRHFLAAYVTHAFPKTKPVSSKAEDWETDYWLIFFEEAGKPCETFSDEAGARHRHKRLLDNWNCHLFRRVAAA